MILDNKEIPWLGKALAVLKRRHMGLQLFNLSYHDLRDAWLTAMKLANLPEGYVVMYQLRHSGASWDRAQGYRTQLEVKHRGRWAADSSML